MYTNKMAISYDGKSIININSIDYQEDRKTEQIKKMRFYSKWLKYIPKFWNLDEIMEKKATDLTVDEILNIYNAKLGLSNAKEIDDYLAIIDKKQVKPQDEAVKKQHQRIIELMDSIDFNSIAVSKLSKSEIKKATKLIYKYFKDNNLINDILYWEWKINDILHLEWKDRRSLKGDIIELDDSYVKDYAIYLLNMVCENEAKMIEDTDPFSESCYMYESYTWIEDTIRKQNMENKKYLRELTCVSAVQKRRVYK